MHFSTLFTTATIALVGLSELASAHLVVIDAWGSNKPGIHGYGLGFSQTNDRKDPGFGRLQDVPVFDRILLHDRNNGTYLPNGCGFSGMSVGNWYKNNKPEIWKANKGKVIQLFRKQSPPQARIAVPKHVENLSLQEGQGRIRTCLATKRRLKTGIPKIARGKSFVVITNTVKGSPRLLNCRIDFRGNGQSWTRPLKNIGCIRGGLRESKGACTPAKLSKITGYRFQLPNDLDCRGTYGPKDGIKNICMVRCQEGSLNGPFGGCIPFQQIKPPNVQTVVVTKTVSGKITRSTQYITRTTRAPTVKPVTTVTSTITNTITRAPPPTRVVTTQVTTVTENRFVYVVVVNGKRITRTATKGQAVPQTITVTRTLKPVIETVSVIIKDVYEDETGGGGDDDGDSSDPALEDEDEDESNTIPDAEGEEELNDNDDGEDENDPFELENDPDAYFKLRFHRD
ncbi:hypothetical protein TWF281_010754 [Arthrobotrys megalospora]